MIGYTAFRIHAAQSCRAGVATLLLNASRGLRALGAHQTLWPTVGRRANVVALTGAHTHSVLHLELTVGSAWVRIAGIQLLDNRHASRHKETLCDGITRVACQTRADRLVAICVADGVDATGARTWIQTLVVHTGPVRRTVCVEYTLGPTG